MKLISQSVRYPFLPIMVTLLNIYNFRLFPTNSPKNTTTYAWEIDGKSFWLNKVEVWY